MKSRVQVLIWKLIPALRNHISRKSLILSVLTWTIYSKKFFTNTRYEKGVLQFGPFHNVYKIYDNMASITKSRMVTELSDIMQIYQKSSWPPLVIFNICVNKMNLQVKSHFL